MAVRGAAVRKKAKVLLNDTWQSQANLSLFLFLLILISAILPALGLGREDARLYNNVGFSILLISGVAIAWGRPRLLAAAAIVGGIALLVRWIAWWEGTLRLAAWSDWTSIAGCLMISAVLLTQIFRTGRVTHMRIQGAIAVYLLLGAAWSHAYHVTQILHPGSFSFPNGEVLTAVDWTYFSFVTLTTVGYGDITPVRPIARSLAVSEALTGQLYLAVMIARLVAMEMVFWQQKVQNGDS